MSIKCRKLEYLILLKSNLTQKLRKNSFLYSKLKISKKKNMTFYYEV